MGRKWFNALVQYLVETMPCLEENVLAGACVVRLRVGNFDKFVNQWGIQLRAPQLEREKLPGSRRSIYQARTQRLFCWNGRLGCPSDTFLSQQQIYGKSLLSYFINATAGMRHEAKPVHDLLTDSLADFLRSICKLLNEQEVDRLYLKPFFGDGIGTGSYFVAKRFDGDPSQFPSRHNGSLFKAWMMAATSHDQWSLQGESELEVSHTVALSKLTRTLKKVYPGNANDLDLLRNAAVRTMKGAEGYDHC